MTDLRFFSISLRGGRRLLLLLFFFFLCPLLREEAEAAAAAAVPPAVALACKCASMSTEKAGIVRFSNSQSFPRRRESFKPKIVTRQRASSKFMPCMSASTAAAFRCSTKAHSSWPDYCCKWKNVFLRRSRGYFCRNRFASIFRQEFPAPSTGVVAAVLLVRQIKAVKQVGLLDLISCELHVWSMIICFIFPAPDYQLTCWWIMW